MTAKQFFSVAVICIAVIGVAASGEVANGDDVPANIVANGGFEDGEGVGSDPASWNATRVSSMKEYHFFEWDDEVSHSGGKSASILIRDNHPDILVFYNWNQAPLNCSPGMSYMVSGWVKAQDLTEPASIFVQCWDRGMKKILKLANTTSQSEVMGTTDWVQVTTVFEVPEDTWRVVILAGVPGYTNNGGRAWFDDIVIAPVSGD